MSIRNLFTQARKLADAIAPKCVPGETRELRRWRRYEDKPYQFVEDDRCPNCGVLGCGVTVIEEVVVTRGSNGTPVDAQGIEVTPL
ncbi:hypothetical protein VT84_05135 [Gemmata sp. SH-PL17]|uniref:hypothetical protein n=1 Tax=Gemmata sp. SH-PL17 TaxID=1630693 RepID=UPI0004B738C4|nr:hypothetical protein [Gemmata sp. SH-PL17]AMV23774.1 hypothetical protein VT84_05135 [Gemmata sp. SH-PL17]